MVSKNEIKFVRSLSLKKKRDESGFFIAEGRKVVGELLESFRCEKLYCSPDCKNCIPASFANLAELVSKQEIERLSLQKTPQGILGVFRKPKQVAIRIADVAQNELCLALDGIQDPGNMGTILRIADWFGINHVFVGDASVDVFSPKVVSATMGAIARINVHYVDLCEELHVAKGANVYGTFLDGENIYSSELSNHGVIVMGNEGNGISDTVGNLVSHRLLIPSFPSGRPTSESLNVAIATSIVCAEFRRRNFNTAKYNLEHTVLKK